MSFRPLVFLIISLALVCGLSFFINFHSKNSDEPFSLKIGNKDINLIVVKTAEAKHLGLGGRDSLLPDTAMLFVFDDMDKYGIWMKDMKFSIDIIWLDENNRIVHLEKNISPNTYPTIFFPPEKSLYIIEANRGFIQQNELSVGNILSISKK
jgi:uncharacterized membrane protein (UPF0127 family)